MSSKSSTTDDQNSPNILVGLIHKPHGLRGEVTVEALSDNADRFAKGAQLRLSVPGVPARTVVVRSSRNHGRGLVVGFEGVENRDHAEELRRGRLEVPQDAVPPAPEGEYYHFELVGCSCYDGDDALGVVEGVVEDGGGVILQVRQPDGELLIPFVKDFLVAIDTAARHIELALPEGLVDACKSRS